MEFIYLILFFLGMSGLIIWSVNYLMVSAERIHDKLNVVLEEAWKAETDDELKSAWDNLVTVNKECFHKSFIPKVTEIKTIIETKYRALV